MEYKIKIEYTLNPKKIAYMIIKELNTTSWLYKPTSLKEMLDYLDNYYADGLIENHFEIDFSDLDEENKKLIAYWVWNEYQKLV